MVTKHWKPQDSPKNFIHCCFTLQFALTADDKYCKTVDPMKCNQLGFCLGISGYSTLQNRRHSEEFHSLIVFRGMFTVLQYLWWAARVTCKVKHQWMKFFRLSTVLQCWVTANALSKAQLIVFHGVATVLQYLWWAVKVNCKIKHQWMKFFGVTTVLQCWVTTNV